MHGHAVAAAGQRTRQQQRRAFLQIQHRGPARRRQVVGRLRQVQQHQRGAAAGLATGPHEQARVRRQIQPPVDQHLDGGVQVDVVALPLARSRRPGSSAATAPARPCAAAPPAMPMTARARRARSPCSSPARGPTGSPILDRHGAPARRARRHPAARCPAATHPWAAARPAARPGQSARAPRAAAGPIHRGPTDRNCHRGTAPARRAAAD